MKNIASFPAVLFLTAALYSSTALAQESPPYTGSFGPSVEIPAAPVTPAPPTPPVMQKTPVAATDAATITALPADPCTEFMSSHDAYAFCQDRVKKMQRMKDAKEKRAAANKPKPEPEQQPAAPTSEQQEAPTGASTASEVVAPTPAKK